MKKNFNFLLRQHFFFFFVALEVVSFILIVQNNYYQQAGFNNATSEIAGNILTRFNEIKEYFSLRSTNQKLAEENAWLRAELMKLKSFRDDNVFTKRDTAFKLQYQYISAKVIRNSTNKRNNYLLLNKGGKDGISKDMGIICGTGVVGIVQDVSVNFCSIMSVLHKDSKISARIRKSGQLGTVIWKGENYQYGELIDIPTHIKPAIGDTIITSGYSTSFPEGIPIGTINNYRIEKGDNFYTISVKFTTDFNNISYTYIIKDIMKDEVDELTKNLPND